MKRCCKCKRSKKAVLFGKNRSSKAGDGLHPECNKCVKDRKALFYIKNKKAINESGRIYSKQKRKVDLNYRLKGNLRARLNAAIKNNQKCGSAIKDLGCSIEFLRVYLEDKFVRGMSWTNYGIGKGKWNIDHIVPLAQFNLTDPVSLGEACHYSNLQPLWHEDNLMKSDN